MTVQLLISPSWNNVQLENERDSKLNDWADQKELPQEHLDTPSLLTPDNLLERTAEKTSIEAASTLEKLKAANTLEELKQELNDLAPTTLVNNASFYKILAKKAPLLGDRVILGLFLKIAREEMDCKSGRMGQRTLQKQSNVRQVAISRAEKGKKSKNVDLIEILKTLKNQNINQFILNSSSFSKKLKNKIKKIDCSLIHLEFDLSSIYLESEDTNKPKQSLPSSPRPLEHTVPKTSSGNLNALEQLLAGGIDAMTSEGLKKIHTEILEYSFRYLEHISDVSQKTIYRAEQDISTVSKPSKEKILNGIKKIVAADAQGIKRIRTIAWSKGIKRKLTLKGEETSKRPARKSAKLYQPIVIDKQHSPLRAISANLSIGASSRGVCAFPLGNELSPPPGVDLPDEFLRKTGFPLPPLPSFE